MTDDYIHTYVLASVGPFFFLWSRVIRPVPIFAWVLINTDVVLVIKIGAYILGCLFCMSAYYLNFTVLLYMYYEQNITM